MNQGFTDVVSLWTNWQFANPLMAFKKRPRGGNAQSLGSVLAPVSAAFDQAEAERRDAAVALFRKDVEAQLNALLADQRGLPLACRHGTPASPALSDEQLKLLLSSALSNALEQEFGLRPRIRRWLSTSRRKYQGNRRVAPFFELLAELVEVEPDAGQASLF